MKKILLILFIAVFIVACHSSKKNEKKIDQPQTEVIKPTHEELEIIKKDTLVYGIKEVPNEEQKMKTSLNTIKPIISKENKIKSRIKETTLVVTTNNEPQIISNENEKIANKIVNEVKENITQKPLIVKKFDHSTWTVFLNNYVSPTGNVHYKAIKANENELTTYLNQLSEIRPDSSWTKNETLAYWINAYNAFTIKLIIDNYPLKSIKDIRNPWDKDFIKIGEETMSLGHIEHEILRKMNEPRIHFAIVCASVSCPKLKNNAYTAATLDLQLSKAAEVFLKDPNRNIITKNSVQLSRIFKWFSSDFQQEGSLIEFLNKYSQLKISKDAKVKFKDYNWNLND